MHVYKVRALLAVFVAFEVLNDEDRKRGRGKTKQWIRRKDERGYFNSHAVFQRILSYIEQDITRKQVLGGNNVISPKERLALTISHAQNCLALLPSLHPWWPWLRLLNCACACACSTMLKERGKWLRLRFNIPNIPENKRNVERMLKQSLKAFKLFQHRFNTFQHCHLTKSKGCWSKCWGHLLGTMHGPSSPRLHALAQLGAHRLERATTTHSC